MGTNSVIELVQAVPPATSQLGWKQHIPLDEGLAAACRALSKAHWEGR